MLKLGATSLPLAGWVADPERPEESQAHRLAAIRQLVEVYKLSAVELTADLGVIYPHIFDGEFYAAVADLQQALGFACTVHLPFLWVDLCSLNEPIRQASVDCMQRVVECVQPLDVDTYVLHLWGFTTTQITVSLQDSPEREAILAVLMGQAHRSLAQVCEFLEPRDLCVENLEDALFDIALPVIKQLGTSICLDVGHLAWQTYDELEFLTRHAGRVREVHLHDALSGPPGERRAIRDHLALGQGHVDYRALLDRLVGSGFDGAVILELNTQVDLERSVEALREIF